MIYLFHATDISVDLAHHMLFRAKGGKGGTCIIWNKLLFGDCDAFKL